MFFTHIARIVAVLALFLGALNIVIGLSVVNGWMGMSMYHLARYTAAATPGAAIDRGIYVIVFAVALGTLAEIGLAIRKNRGP